MKFFSNLTLVALLVLLASCSGFRSHSEIEALNEVEPVGSPFTQHLAEEYRLFANQELNEMFDYPDALHFARKGLAAAAGEVVMPEPVGDWHLLPSHQEELAAARGRLIVAFDMGARTMAARQAAIAQSRFDCWIEQQEEAWQNNDIAGCKSAYLDAIQKLEMMIEPLQPEIEDVLPPVEAVDVPDESEPMKPEDALYLVFFDFDSSRLGQGAENVVDAVADEVQSRQLSTVKLVGHADKAGPRDYNRKLAMKRANAVRDSLVERGVDPNLIRVGGRGEEDPLVQTPDNVREPANRRVEISFEQ